MITGVISGRLLPQSIAASGLDHLWIRLRPSATQAQSICGSDSELPDVCVHKKNSLCADFCGSRAAEEASGKFYVLIDLSHDLHIICHNLGISPLVPSNKGKQGRCVCA